MLRSNYVAWNQHDSFDLRNNRFVAIQEAKNNDPQYLLM